MTSDEGDPVQEARQALRSARERQQAGDRWSSGYEAGRAYGLLLPRERVDPRVIELQEELHQAQNRAEEAEERASELWNELNDARQRANEAEDLVRRLRREHEHSFREGRNYTIARVVNSEPFQESEMTNENLGDAIGISQTQISRISHEKWGPDDE